MDFFGGRPLPELAFTRVIRKGVPPLPSQIPLKVEESEPYIQNREKNRVSLRVVLWLGGIMMLVTLVVWILWIQAKNLEVPFTATKAKEFQKAVAKSLRREVEEITDLGKNVKLEMVLIPAGKFKMGSSASERGRSDNETQHEVTLTNPFYVGKYEVTQKQWERLMGKNPSTIKGAELPVTDVSWEDCQEFIKKLNAKTDGGYRLPTEAEWEYACRAGTKTAYSFVNEITNYANYNGSGNNKPTEVGGYKPNSFGLYDMHGNVWEWCEDWLADYPPGAVTDPKGNEKKEIRLLRGGSFLSDETSCRSSYRHRGATDYKHLSNGFRLAMTADLKTGGGPIVTWRDPPKEIPPIVNLLEAPFTETNAKDVQKAVAKSLLREIEETDDFGNSISLEMVLIPAGQFKMGSPESERQHEVTLIKPFYIGKYEVTQKQWEGMMGDNLSQIKGPKLPVTNV